MKKSTLLIIPTLLLAGSISSAAEGDYKVIPEIVKNIEEVASSKEAQTAKQGVSEVASLAKSYAIKGYNIALLESIEAAELSQSFTGGYLVVSSAKLAVEGLVAYGVYRFASKIPLVNGATRGFLSKGAWIIGAGTVVNYRDNEFDKVLLNKENLEATKAAIRNNIEAAQIQIDEAFGK